MHDSQILTPIIDTLKTLFFSNYYYFLNFRGILIHTFFEMALYRISVVCVLVCYATSLAQRCIRTDSLKDHRLVGHVISSDKENNIWGCFQACKTNLECRSLNYNLETSICEINNRTKNEKPHKFVALEGSVYVDNPFRGKRKNGDI